MNLNNHTPSPTPLGRGIYVKLTLFFVLLGLLLVGIGWLLHRGGHFQPEGYLEYEEALEPTETTNVPFFNTTLHFHDLTEVHITTTTYDVEIRGVHTLQDLRIVFTGSTEPQMQISEYYVNQAKSLSITTQENGEYGSIVVYAPIGKLEALSVNSTHGQITIEAIEVNFARMYTTNGDVTVNSSNFDAVGISSNSGTIEINRISFIDLVIDSVNGNVKIVYANAIGGAIEIASTYGDISFRTTAPVSHFFYRVQSFGRVYVNGETVTENDHHGGSVTGVPLDIISVSGDVNLQFGR